MRQTRIMCWSSFGRLDRVALIGLDHAEVSGTIEKRKESAVEGSEKATPMVIGHGGRAN